MSQKPRLTIVVEDDVIIGVYGPPGYEVVIADYGAAEDSGASGDDIETPHVAHPVRGTRRAWLYREVTEQNPTIEESAWAAIARQEAGE